MTNPTPSADGKTHKRGKWHRSPAQKAEMRKRAGYVRSKIIGRLAKLPSDIVEVDADLSPHGIDNELENLW